MCILFYAEEADWVGKKLQKVMQSAGCGQKLEIFHSFTTLSLRLHRPKYDLKLMVILIATKNELFELLYLRNELENIPLIMILPDQEKDSVAIACKLFPRFIGYREDKLSEVSGVIRRILRNRKNADREVSCHEKVQRF